MMYSYVMTFRFAFILLFVIGCFSLPLLVSVESEELKNFSKVQQRDDSQNAGHAPVFKIKAKEFEQLSISGIIDRIDSKSVSSLITVESGIYLKSLGKFDYSKKTYFVNFYIWWLLDDPTYFPEKTVEITNAEEYKILWSERDTIRAKTRVLARYIGTISHDWNMRYFPFDRQKLRISFEDNLLDIKKVNFSPIPQNSKISPDVSLKGWNLETFDFVHEDHLYDTNFGDLDTPESVYSRLNIILELKREGWSIFFVYYIGYILAAFLSFLTYFIPKRYFDITNTISLGAIFAGIGNKYQLSETLSDPVGLSLSGIFTLCTFILIVLTIINTVLTHLVYTAERRKLSFVMNYATFFILFLVYGVVMSSAIQEAIRS